MICLPLHLLFMLAVAAQEPAADAVQHMQAGISAEKQGQHQAAISEFQQAAQLQPDLTAAYVDLGMVYMGQHNYAEAISPLKHAVALDPGMAAAQEMLGYALLSQGYAGQAVPHLQAAGNQGMLGLAELETGDMVHAIEHLQAGLAQHPDDAELLDGMARAAGILSRETKDTLVATHPESGQAHLAVAADYQALKKNAEAEAEYRKALQIEPGLPGAHLQLGEMYQDSAQWQKAEMEYRAETTARPGSAEAAYRLGNALLQNGKISQAVTELRRADGLQPDMPETLFALGKAESLDGKTPAAEKDWNHLLAIEKDSDLAEKTHFALAGVYRKLGKPHEAELEMKAYEQLKAQRKE